jgi:hypothetical protein
MTFSKTDILALLQSPAQVSRAIEILGNNQRQDELASRSTNHQNGIGFTSCWASSGTHLWQFVTGYDGRTGTNKWGRKCLSHPNWKRAKIIRRKVYNNGCENAVELGRRIAVHHWRQLGEMLPTQPVLQAVSAPEPETPQADFEAILVPADKADIARMILEKYNII